MQPYWIRRANAGDLPALFLAEGGETEGLREYLRRHLNWQAEGTCAFLIALADDGRAAGRLFVLFDDSMPPDYQTVLPSLADLLVYPPFRRQGVAGALLAAGEWEAFARSERIFLTVEAGETLAFARRLYEKHGFAAVKSRGEDPVCMIKTRNTL